MHLNKPDLKIFGEIWSIANYKLFNDCSYKSTKYFQCRFSTFLSSQNLTTIIAKFKVPI